MIQPLIQRVQNYADALFSGFTKTAQNGRKVIYPLGVFARGYVIASDEEERRLKQKFAVYLVLVPIVMGMVQALWGYPGSLSAGALIVACYAIYVKRLTANMEPSSEELSLIESFRAQARTHSLRRLWSWTITGIFLVCLGVVLSILTPENRTKTAFLIGLGVLIFAFGGWMLALRRGANPPLAQTSNGGGSMVAEEVATYITGDVGPVRAWFMTTIGLLFSALGIFVFVIAPEERSTAVGITMLFGLIAVFGIAMLVLRRRERHS